MEQDRRIRWQLQLVPTCPESEKGRARQQVRPLRFSGLSIFARRESCFWLQILSLPVLCQEGAGLAQTSNIQTTGC